MTEDIIEPVPTEPTEGQWYAEQSADGAWTSVVITNIDVGKANVSYVEFHLGGSTITATETYTVEEIATMIDDGRWTPVAIPNPVEEEA